MTIRTPEDPQCWMCGSTQVTVKFLKYARAYCLATCKENHQHHEDVPTHTCVCHSCGNTWEDGSGDFAHITQN